jgi:hypothetical protein
MGALSRQVHCKAFEMVERTVSQSSLMSRASVCADFLVERRGFKLMVIAA